MSRTNGAFAVALAAVIVAWSLGSTVIAVAGIAVLVAAVAASMWRRLVRRTVTLTRIVPRDRLVEGDTFRYVVTHTGPRLPGSFILRERIARLGVRELELRGGGVTNVEVGDVPRGRLTLGPSTVVVQDPFGFEQVSVAVPEVAEVIVRPRIPRLGSLHTDGSGRLRIGRGQPLRQPSGSDFHGVREYRAGEAMRAVHWASTARRGRLMVREVTEPSADDVAIVLDLDARADVGPPGRSSLDEAVRVAGGLAAAHGARGRIVRLVIAGSAPQTLTIRSPGDLETMLDLLAVAEPRIRGSWSTQATGPTGPTVLVTARAESAARSAQRLDAVVLIDAPSYLGESHVGSTAPLLGLAGRGVSVTVVRAGDDLADALAGRAPAVPARG
jgi:uncharacterized protein (DUF58 family)